MSGDTTDQRMYLIAQLEGHYGRWIAHEVVQMHGEFAKFYDADKTFTAKQVAGYLEHGVELVTEGREMLEAARQCSDEVLKDLVRWQTNPNWRKAMEESGMTFDTKSMRWKES